MLVEVMSQCGRWWWMWEGGREGESQVEGERLRKAEKDERRRKGRSKDGGVDSEKTTEKKRMKRLKYRGNEEKVRNIRDDVNKKFKSTFTIQY